MKNHLSRPALPPLDRSRQGRQNLHGFALRSDGTFGKCTLGHWGVVCGDKSRSWPRAVGCGCPVIQQGTASPSNKAPHAALCSLGDANLDPSMNLPIPHFALLRIASRRIASHDRVIFLDVDGVILPAGLSLRVQCHQCPQRPTALLDILK